MSGMERMIIVQYFVSEGTFPRFQTTPSAYERSLAKTQSSAEVKKGWRRESKTKVPGMDSSAGFTNGPKPGRLKSTSRTTVPRLVRHKRGI